MADPVVTDALLAELVAVNRSVLAEIRGLRGDLAAAGTRKALPHEDGRYERLFEAVDHALSQTETMAFLACEVVDHAECDVELDEALKACSAETTGKLGRLLRSLNGRDVNGWRPVRDGDGWRLERT